MDPTRSTSPFAEASNKLIPFFNKKGNVRVGVQLSFEASGVLDAVNLISSIITQNKDRNIDDTDQVHLKSIKDRIIQIKNSKMIPSHASSLDVLQVCLKKIDALQISPAERKEAKEIAEFIKRNDKFHVKAQGEEGGFKGVKIDDVYAAGITTNGYVVQKIDDFNKKKQTGLYVSNDQDHKEIFFDKECADAMNKYIAKEKAEMPVTVGPSNIQPGVVNAPAYQSSNQLKEEDKEAKKDNIISPEDKKGAAKTESAKPMAETSKSSVTSTFPPTSAIGTMPHVEPTARLKMDVFADLYEIFDRNTGLKPGESMVIGEGYEVLKNIEDDKKVSYNIYRMQKSTTPESQASSELLLTITPKKEGLFYNLKPDDLNILRKFADESSKQKKM